MLNKLNALLNNQTLLLFLGVVVSETIFTAMLMYFYQVPSDAILNSSLVEVLKIFEG